MPCGNCIYLNREPSREINQKKGEKVGLKAKKEPGEALLAAGGHRDPVQQQQQQQQQQLQQQQQQQQQEMPLYSLSVRRLLWRCSSSSSSREQLQGPGS
ncbi:hypothetical protein EBH_0014560 [Eimeria brunetti]|uniref:Uncharacterized protein n=1 Tax=Eimeria brunetti TaxID=51314 RepID=U6LCY9_9EIME|nr:hypothetical protein EBH_0014560 [Eimeria brunetti]